MAASAERPNSGSSSTGGMSLRRKTRQSDPVPRVGLDASPRATRSQSSSRRGVKSKTVSKSTSAANSTEACSEEYCRFGCVCKSLRTPKVARSKHCGKPECMIACKCAPAATTQEEVTPPSRRPRQIPARFRDGDLLVAGHLRNWKEARNGLAVAVKRTGAQRQQLSGNSAVNGTETNETTRTIVDTDSNNKARLVRIPARDFDVMKWHSVVFIDRPKLPEGVKIYCMEHDVKGCPCIKENPPKKPVTIKPPRTSHRARITSGMLKENEPSLGGVVPEATKLDSLVSDPDTMQQHYWQRIESKFGTLLKDSNLLQELMVQEKLYPVEKELDLTVHERCWRLVSWARFHSLFNEDRFRIRILKRRRGSIVLVMKNSEILASDITVDIRELRGEPDTPSFLRELLEPLTESGAKQYAALYCDGIKWELLGCISVPSIASVETVCISKGITAASLPKSTAVEKQPPTTTSVQRKKRPVKRKASSVVPAQPTNKKTRQTASRTHAAKSRRKPDIAAPWQRRAPQESKKVSPSLTVEVDMTAKSAPSEKTSTESSPAKDYTTGTACLPEKPVLTKAGVMSMLEQARRQLSQSLNRPLPQPLRQDTSKASQGTVHADIHPVTQLTPSYLSAEEPTNSDSLDISDHSYSMQPGTFPHLFSKSILPLLGPLARNSSPTPMRIIEVPMTSESPPPKPMETRLSLPNVPLHSLVSLNGPMARVPFARFPLAESVMMQNFRSGESALRKRLKIQFAGPKETVICLPVDSDDDQWYMLEMSAVPAQGIVVPPKNMCVPRVVFLSALTRALGKPFRAEIQLRSGFDPDPNVRPGFGVIAFPQFREHVFLGPFSRDILKYRFEGANCMLNVNKLQMRPALPRITRIITASPTSARPVIEEKLNKAPGGELSIENEDTESATSWTDDADPADLTNFDLRARALEACNLARYLDGPLENATGEDLVVDVAPDTVPGVSSLEHGQGTRSQGKSRRAGGDGSVLETRRPYERNQTGQLHHVKAERQRRRMLLGLFRELRDLVVEPAEMSQKLGKPSRKLILDNAVQVIRGLKLESEQLASEYDFALRERGFYMEIIKMKSKVLPAKYREVVTSLLSKLQACIPVTFDRPSLPAKRTILLDGQGECRDSDMFYEYDTESANSSGTEMEIDVLE